MGVLMMTNSVVQIIVDCNIKEKKKNIIRFRWTQIRDIYYLVSTRYILKIQDTTTMVGVHVNIALEKFLAFNDEFFGHFSNGKLVTYF